MLSGKELQPQDNVSPQQIKLLFSQWTKEKTSAPPKPSSVRDDTNEDVMECMEIILSNLLLQNVQVFLFK